MAIAFHSISWDISGIMVKIKLQPLFNQINNNWYDGLKAFELKQRKLHTKIVGFLMFVFGLYICVCVACVDILYQSQH